MVKKWGTLVHRELGYVIEARKHPPSDLFKLALLGGEGLKGHTHFKFLQVVVGHDV